MVRVTRGNVAKNRRKKNKKLAKGYIGAHSRISTMISEQIKQSLYFSYISRRLHKRTFRRLWICRINTAIRSRNNIYSKFIGCLRNLNILLNRKMLAILAFNDLALLNVIEKESRKSNIF